MIPRTTHTHTHRHDTHCCSKVANVDSIIYIEGSIFQGWEREFPQDLGHDMVTVSGLAELKVHRLFLGPVRGQVEVDESSGMLRGSSLPPNPISTQGSD